MVWVPVLISLLPSSAPLSRLLDLCVPHLQIGGPDSPGSPDQCEVSCVSFYQAFRVASGCWPFKPRCEREEAAKWPRGGKKTVHSRDKGPEVRKAWSTSGCRTSWNRLRLEKRGPEVPEHQRGSCGAYRLGRSTMKNETA